MFLLVCCLCACAVLGFRVPRQAKMVDPWALKKNAMALKIKATAAVAAKKEKEAAEAAE